MANKTPALTRAQAAFSASEQRTKLVLAEVEKERAASAAKTVKLKALRLAKEAEDRAILAENPPPPKPRRKRIT